ncbi:MAG: cytochrome C biogenesis protein CcmF [Gemmatimonadetes bacterium]|nr:MAG: cytochrome C biogenesis protein CcmF [Gemmatimonadota bacterium]
MNALVGHLATLLALLLAGVGAAAAFVGGRRGDARYITGAQRAGIAVFVLVALAFLIMERALITHDFSVSYVAQVGSRETPLFYTVISLWSALEGSILLWALVLSIYTALLVRWSRRRADPTGDAQLPYALGTLLCVNVFFLLLISWPANPFRLMSPVPADGPGPNALLQNSPFMGVHPPLLYTGYVGMSVPFALATGALLAGRLNPDWTKVIRRWTLVPWTFLSLGILAGAWWSYEVLGWGGYWAWDPVENASFMPWLTATAFLHSVMVQERRGMLKTWTITLIVATFLLTVLGTFLTRSGVLASVHAFTQSAIGPFFLTFLGLVLLGSLALLAWRSEALRSEGRFDAALSRETAFMLNNLLFAAFAFVVLLGTMFPLIAEAIRGVRVSVGGPYFSEMSVPIALLLIFLAGVGPALPWRKGSLELLRGKFRWPTMAALGTAVILAAAGVRAPLALLAFALAAFSFGLLAAEFIGPTRVRRRTTGEAGPLALWRVVAGNRRRYGGYIVHAGILVVAVGVTGSATFRREQEWNVGRGAAVQFGRYQIQFDSVWAVSESNRDGVIAATTVSAGGRLLTRLSPRLNYYPTSMEPIGTPAVRESLREDLYLVLLAYAADGSHATIKAIASPLVGWIWLGGGIVALGAVFSLWRGAAARQPRPAPVPGAGERPGAGRARAVTEARA